MKNRKLPKDGPPRLRLRLISAEKKRDP